MYIILQLMEESLYRGWPKNKIAPILDIDFSLPNRAKDLKPRLNED